MKKKKKRKLEEILKEMGSIDWSKVQDCKLNKDYMKLAPKFFRKFLGEAGLKLEGSVLDVCCGPVSLGSIHDDVVGYDILPGFIKELRKKNVNGVVGCLKELPFEENSFDQVVCIGVPLRPLQKVKTSNGLEYKPHDIVGHQAYVDDFVYDCIRIARRKALFVSLPIVSFLPEKYRWRIERISNSSVLYNFEKSFLLKKIFCSYPKLGKIKKEMSFLPK